MTTTTERIDHLEQRARLAEERLRRLELATALPVVPAPPATVTQRGQTPLSRSLAEGGQTPLSHPVAEERQTRPAQPAPRPTLEELLGGRVLAWVGGAAVLVGLALLFALGVSNGWIGEAERCAIAAAGCAVLLGAGLRLHERSGRTEAARAAVATALAGLFLTLVVATAGYELVPPAAGIVLAAAVGALGVAIAVRWASPTIAALGIVGALLAPAVAGVSGEVAALWFVGIAAAAAVAVVVWQRWTWLSVCVAVVVTPQWLAWLALEERGLVATLVVLVAFGALQAVAAAGSALRAPGEQVRALPALLLAANALVLGLVGFEAVQAVASRPAEIAWLAGLAAAHLALGLAARLTPRVAPDLGLLCLLLGVVLADVAFATATDGVLLAVGWAASAVAFAALARAGTGRDESAAAAGIGVHVGLSVLAAAPAVDLGTLLGGGAPSSAVTTMLAALAAACLVSGRLTPPYRLALDVAGLAAAALLAALALDGVALTTVWVLEAVVLCSLGVRGAGDGVAWGAGLAHMAGAAVWCLADQAPPVGLYDGVTDLGLAALGVAAVLAGLARVAALVEEEDRPLLLGALALGALHLASLAVVTAGADVRGGQLNLTALWAVVGVAALLAGLRRDVAAVRAAALALLAATIAKVFVYDLATQEAAYRVVSFLGLGVLLLAAAFAYQRFRPEAPRDLRDVPPALRS